MAMKQTVYLFILCTVLTIAGCSDRSNNADSDEAKAAWQRYIEIRQTKDLGRTLAIIDTMESSKYISTARANFLRGITFDKGWQMRLAEHVILFLTDRLTPMFLNPLRIKG